jgi:hypothetical protein
MTGGLWFEWYEKSCCSRHLNRSTSKIEKRKRLSNKGKSGMPNPQKVMYIGLMIGRAF